MEQKPPRVITGIAKGKKLSVPESARPMTDRIKTSIFDLLGNRVESAKVADLFSGSGNLGIEALSRGALFVTFIDDDQQAIETINSNLSVTDFLEQAEVIKQDANKICFDDLVTKYDIIFADPPFPAVEKFDISGIHSVLSDDGILVFRKPTEVKVNLKSSNLSVIHSEIYGISEVLFISHSSEYYSADENFQPSDQELAEISPPDPESHSE